MVQYDTWAPYSGTDAFILSGLLIVLAGALAYLGFKLPHPVDFQRADRGLGMLLVMMWVLAVASFFVARATYIRELLKQYGEIVPMPNPIHPVTTLSMLITFTLITFFARRHGWKVALGSGIIGTIIAPSIFELPFGLIVAPRAYPPLPAKLFILLLFLPLNLVEISSFSLLALSPLTKLTKYTLFAIAGMFLVFSVWALFGFTYPSGPLPVALNATSKVLAFVASMTMFIHSLRQP